jgi:succinate dehydrogenase/fumarate reductase cytochrome b subunit
MRSPAKPTSELSLGSASPDLHSMLRKVHRTSAIFIAAFAFAHLANHLVALSSVAAHIAFMEALRSVYRHRLVETVLLSSVTVQVLSGMWLVMHRWKQRKGKMAWLQAISGAYLSFFLLVHVAAVLLGRSVLKLDTNFYFAAAGFYVPPYQYFFAPYYFLAVLALLTHLGCAAYWQLAACSRATRMLALAIPLAAGSVIALLIVLSLAGMLRQVDMPAKYTATYVR